MSTTPLEQVVTGFAPLVQRLTVPQFHRMLDEGIIREGEPIELIDGLLVHKDRRDAEGAAMTHGPRHAAAVRRLQELDSLFRARGAHMRTQLPVTLSDVLEPEPDGAVVIGGPEDFSLQHPTRESVLLAIEVAASSLAYDRSTKLEIYASAGIPTYWIVDLVDDVLEVYQEPDQGAASYKERRTFGHREQFSLSVRDRGELSILAGQILD